MVTISNKTKQFLVLLLKLLVVVGAFYFIYDRLASDEQLDWNKFKDLIWSKTSFWSILFILSLSFLNRFLEILKWQNLVQIIKPISVWEATEQVLGALTLALFTPNGIGEYAGKALFFEKIKTKKVIFLNLICNGIQLILTIFFGILGLIYFNSHFNIISTKVIIFVFGISFLFFLFLFFLKKNKD